ncbi:MAG: helix-turn-helix domain-containing protein [Actinobacteria bacterium]|nr:helix-turn-helix domain-containing protein [Actinomycetota bacterium]
MLDSAYDRRAALVRSLLQGTLPFAEAAAAARTHGLMPSERYRALRARPGGRVSAHDLTRMIAAAGAVDGRGALAAVLDDEVVGVVARAPRVPPGVVAGLGTACCLAGLDSSFMLATRALETAIAYGIEGVVDIDELSLRPAILTEPHLGERLMDRYIRPLTSEGPFGETLRRTVHEYLARGMRVRTTADSLYVHPNTLRHRLDRFEEITRADLSRTQVLLELWWALERHRLDAALGRTE